jgi:hypothetical protein
MRWDSRKTSLFNYLENHMTHGKYVLGIECVFHFSQLLFDIIHPDKYLVSCNWDANRNACRSSRKMSVLLCDFQKPDVPINSVRLLEVIFHENLYGSSQVVTCGWKTDRHCIANRYIFATSLWTHLKCKQIWSYDPLDLYKKSQLGTVFL